MTARVRGRTFTLVGMIAPPVYANDFNFPAMSKAGGLLSQDSYIAYKLLGAPSRAVADK